VHCIWKYYCNAICGSLRDEFKKLYGAYRKWSLFELHYKPKLLLDNNFKNAENNIRKRVIRIIKILRKHFTPELTGFHISTGFHIGLCERCKWCGSTHDRTCTWSNYNSSHLISLYSKLHLLRYTRRNISGITILRFLDTRERMWTICWVFSCHFVWLIEYFITLNIWAISLYA